jgi:hypothetical protein
VQLVFHFAYPRFLILVNFFLFQRGIMARRAQPNIVEIACAHGFATPPASLPSSGCRFDRTPAQQKYHGQERRDPHAPEP